MGGDGGKEGGEGKDGEGEVRRKGLDQNSLDRKRNEAEKGGKFLSDAKRNF